MTVATGDRLTPRDLVEALKEWSILDIVEAIKGIEDTFGIKAAVAQLPAEVQPGQPTVEPEQQTEFTVKLTAVGDRKIDVIKVVRAATMLGLKESKELVDKTPSVVLEGVDKAKAEELVAALKQAGAGVEII